MSRSWHSWKIERKHTYANQTHYEKLNEDPPEKNLTENGETPQENPKVKTRRSKKIKRI